MVSLSYGKRDMQGKHHQPAQTIYLLRSKPMNPDFRRTLRHDIYGPVIGRPLRPRPNLDIRHEDADMWRRCLRLAVLLLVLLLIALVW